jgi:hypothetical protein
MKIKPPNQMSLLHQPREYYLIYLSSLLFGIVVFICPNNWFTWLSATTYLKINWRLFVGEFLIYFTLSQFIIQLLIIYTDKLINIEDIVYIIPGEQWGPILVGNIEAILYPFSIIIGKPEFIGVWLALKVAGNWIGWGTETIGNTKEKRKTNENEDFIPDSARKGRKIFNKFLFGCGLRIIFAYLIIGIMRITGALP